MAAAAARCTEGDAAALACTQDHVAYALAAVYAALHEREVALVPADFGGGSAPFFVTLDKWDGRARDYHLRGCIGTLSPRPLSEIAAYACKSAFSDRRFDPLAASEFDALQCTVSLLVGFEPAPHPEDWDVGTHGIVIDFRADGVDYSATYLPHVASEQGWSKREALTSLVRKAGYSRAPSADLLRGLRVTRYRSSTAEMTVAEWAKLPLERRFLVARARGSTGGGSGR